MPSRTIKLVLSAAITLIIMCSIFSMSGQSGGESGSLSESVARIIASMFVSGFDALPVSEQDEIVGAIVPPLRKLAHASEYAILAISLMSTCWQAGALLADGKASSRSLLARIALIAVIAFALTFAYACTDELHQLFIDGRSGKFADVLVDSAGAIVGLLVSSCIAYGFMRRRITST